MIRKLIYICSPDVTLASIFCIITSLIGLVGALLDSRPILAAYAILLWPCGFMLLAIGYSSYKKEALSLDLKLNQAWSQFYDDEARLRLQDSLRCCGYYSPFRESTPSSRPGVSVTWFPFPFQTKRHSQSSATPAPRSPGARASCSASNAGSSARPTAPRSASHRCTSSTFSSQ